MRVRVIGDITGLSEKIQKDILELENATKDYDGLNFTIALNYGGRDEIVRATRKIVEDVKKGVLSEDELTEQIYAGYLDTAQLPDPDLMIRTSYELRTSNFLPWQLAYSEFYFTEVPWPDFDEEQLKLAVEAYEKRDRRFGLVKE